MKFMKVFYLVLIIFALETALTTPALSYHDGGGDGQRQRFERDGGRRGGGKIGKREKMGKREHRGGRRQDLIFKQLELNTKQQKQVLELKKANMKEEFKYKSKIRNYKHLLQMEMMEKKLNDKEITNLIEKIGENDKKLMKSKYQFLKGLRKILTEEQIIKLDLQIMSKGRGRKVGM